MPASVCAALSLAFLATGAWAHGQFTEPSVCEVRSNSATLTSSQCECNNVDDNQFRYFIDPEPKKWLNTKTSQALKTQCHHSDIAVKNTGDTEDVGAFRQFSRLITMGRTFFHPNYFDSNYSSQCGSTSCTASTDGIGGVTYYLSDLQKNFPSATMYLGLSENLTWGIGGKDTEKCWDVSPWYQLEPGFSLGDARDFLCLREDDPTVECSNSGNTMLRLVNNSMDCVKNTSWIVQTVLSSVAVINQEDLSYNNPTMGIYNWNQIIKYFTLQDYSSQFLQSAKNGTGYSENASRLLSVQMPTLGLYSTCPYGGQTFQQVYPVGFQAKVSGVNIVKFENGTELPDGACICPSGPMWVRLSNDIFASDVQKVLVYYRIGSVISVICGGLIWITYIRAEYLQRQPYSLMARMGVCEALFALTVLIWTYTHRDNRETNDLSGWPIDYSAENFNAQDGDPYHALSIPTTKCIYFSPWTQFLIMGSVLYYGCVSLHLHNSIRNPFLATPTLTYDIYVIAIAVGSVVMLFIFSAADPGLIDGYSQFLFCWVKRKLSVEAASFGDINYALWVLFYAPLISCLMYTLYVSKAAEKSLNDGLNFSSTARLHALTSNRRFVLMNVGLWFIVGLPTVLLFLAPPRCVPSSTLSAYGIVLGLRGLSNLGLWIMCIPGLWDLLQLQYLIRKAKLKMWWYSAYSTMCPCLQSKDPQLTTGLDPLLDSDFQRNLSGSDNGWASDMSDRNTGVSRSRSEGTDLSMVEFLEASEDTQAFDAMRELRDRHMEVVARQSEADYFLRAEVVWLVSWGTLFNLVKHFQANDTLDPWDEDHLYWPENHSIQEMNALKEILTSAEPVEQTTFRFRTFNPSYNGSYKFSILRQIFSDAIVGALPQNHETFVRSKFTDEELSALDQQVPCDLKQLNRTHVQSLPKWELDYVFSMCPQIDQVDIISKEKFNIGGKSGAPFYFTHDSRYIIKMITQTESQDFCVFSSSYFTYLTQKGPEGQRSNLNSLLLRVYGCHAVRVRATQAPQYFLVMANLTNFVSEGGVCERRYDLKGSSAGREEMDPVEMQHICKDDVHAGNRCLRTNLPTLLDNDYRMEKSYGLGIRISLQDKQKLLKQMLRDCIFLASENIMDYSMLVGRWRRTDPSVFSPLDSGHGVMHKLHVIPHEEDRDLFYYFGFIDITQHYNFNKKAERYLKRILYCRPFETMSACPPVQSARRFLVEMNHYIDPELDNFESEVDLTFEHLLQDR